MKFVLLLVCAAVAWPHEFVVRGKRLTFHFVASKLGNLTFQLDAMAGLSQADGGAYKNLWKSDLRWDREDDIQLERWRVARARQRSAAPAPTPPVIWPPNYAAFYGGEFRLDQNVRIAGFQAGDLRSYEKRLRKLLPADDAAALASVVKHFEARMEEFWLREAMVMTEPHARDFAVLVRDREVLPLTEELMRFVEPVLSKRHHVWFYLMAHPKRFGSATMATQMQNHAPVEFTEDEKASTRLSVILHELVHHFYDSAPFSKHAGLIDSFHREAQPWRMAAYSYLNEAVATAAQILIEQRLRPRADFDVWIANGRNVYSQPWVAALGKATWPVLEQSLRERRTLFDGFAERYLLAAGEGLGERVSHPHFLLASRVVIYGDESLRPAYGMFRERVPSILHAGGLESMEKYPKLPVVLLTLDGERAEMERRIGGRAVTVLAGATAVEVERAVEQFALEPF